MTVQKAVGQIAGNSCDEQRARPPRSPIHKDTLPRQNRKEDQGGKRKGHEEKIVVLQNTESRGGVVNLDKIKKPRDDRDHLVGRNIANDQRFRELIQSVKGQRDQQPELHDSSSLS